MENRDLFLRAGEADGTQTGAQEWTAKEIRLRNSIAEHCRWIATFDRDYAKWAYRYYREELPWLKL